MVVISRGAYNQVHDIITWYCDYHTPQEYGRSAFWIWIDKIHAEVNNVSLRKAKKLKSGEYVYRMQYWCAALPVITNQQNAQLQWVQLHPPKE